MKSEHNKKLAAMMLLLAQRRRIRRTVLNKLSSRMQQAGEMMDGFAMHEILDRTYCVATMVELLLLDRGDLPAPVREKFELAVETLWAAYQDMGRLGIDTDPNRGNRDEDT